VSALEAGERVGWREWGALEAEAARGAALPFLSARPAPFDQLGRRFSYL